ncbi:MAG: AfsR/SARP family transcriptional regulator [Streptosporangiaceae bacterium]
MRQSTSITGLADSGNAAGGCGDAGRITLRVLGRFDLVAGSRAIPLGTNCQRLLTLLAVRDCHVSRACAAGTLWPEATASRANANLRSVLWRLQRCCAQAAEASFYDIRLAPGVTVDIQEVCKIARQLLDRSITRDAAGLSEALSCNLYDDIVPDLGDEEWLMVERERYRQLHLHALESLSEELIAIGWYGAAVEAALGVTRIDPFRESARQLLVRAYLAEGNQLEARRQLKEYRNLLRRELGLEPTDRFLRLMPAPAAPRPPAGESSARVPRQPARVP